jgi:hypothetical protein
MIAVVTVSQANNQAHQRQWSAVEIANWERLVSIVIFALLHRLAGSLIKFLHVCSD